MYVIVTNHINWQGILRKIKMVWTGNVILTYIIDGVDAKCEYDLKKKRKERTSNVIVLLVFSSIGGVDGGTHVSRHAEYACLS